MRDLRGFLLGLLPGGSSAGFPVSAEPARPENPSEREPRLLVDHGGEDSRIPGSVWAELHIHPAQQLRAVGGLALCGTRGWFFEEETGAEHDRKIMLREIGRLETSLKAAGEAEKLVFLHYPAPVPGVYLIRHPGTAAAYGVRECYYGHIHSRGCRSAFQGTADGVHFRLISGDYLDFIPLKVR